MSYRVLFSGFFLFSHSSSSFDCVSYIVSVLIVF